MPRLRALIAASLLATAVACESNPSDIEIAPTWSKGGGGPIQVDATDPTEAPQDTTLEVSILGSGFERGSEARFLLGGAPTANVVTNRTRFVSDTELAAEITIAIDADVALYDVEVSSSGGRRRGIGTELFSVLQKTNGPTSGDVVTVFMDDAGHRILSDGAIYEPVKKRQAVETEISTSGQHGLKLNERSNRTVCVAFPPEGPDAEIVSQADWDALVASSGGAVALGTTYCGLITMHTRDHTHPDQLIGMDVDPTTPDLLDVQTSGGKLVLKEFDDLTSWEWRLLFDDSHSSIAGGADDNGLCIRYHPDRTWTIGNDATLDSQSEDSAACDGIDDIVNLWHVTPVGGNGSNSVTYTLTARFRMPFTYTVTPLF